MANRYATEVRRLLSSLLDAPGATTVDLRRAVVEDAKLAVAEPLVPLRSGTLPPEISRYVETVARHAYRVTDDDVEGLKRAGHSEEEIFDVTVSAAVSSALYRLERGMAALQGTTTGERQR